jgi:hypothetical protein
LPSQRLVGRDRHRSALNLYNFSRRLTARVWRMPLS